MNNGSRFGELGLIIANSHPKLGLEVASELSITPLKIESEPYPNGERRVRRLCDVSGKDICIFSSLHAGYDTVRELRLICNTLKSASRVFGVFPFVRDGKSDHIKTFGETVAYKDTAMEISSSGLEAIAIFDQHSAQHASFAYDTTHYRLRVVHHAYLMRILIEYAEKNSGLFDSVVALDDGGFKRNKKIAEMLNKKVSFILKHRDPETRAIDLDKSTIIGNVRGKRVVAFDDMIQGGDTSVMGAIIAKKNGAKEVSIFVVHNDFTPETFDKINPWLEDGTIDKIYTLETIPLRDEMRWHKNLVVLSPAKLIAEVVSLIHSEGHMRELFLEL